MVEVVVYNGAAALDEEMLRQEPSHLRSRLGELTLSGDNDGMWLLSFGGKSPMKVDRKQLPPPLSQFTSVGSIN